MSDLLQVSDLERAKLHDTFHSEVITGKAGGLSTGANIDYATNAVTWQVQKTLPATVNGIDWSYVGKLADGVTFTKKTDFAIDASGTQWIYTGNYPFTATAGTVPSEPTYQVVHVKSASAISNENGGSVQDFIDAQYTTVAELATGKFQVGQYVRLADRALRLFLLQSGGVANGKDTLDAGGGNTAALQLNGCVFLEWLGGVLDGVFDNSDIIDRAFELDVKTVYCGYGDCRITRGFNKPQGVSFVGFGGAIGAQLGSQLPATTVTIDGQIGGWLLTVLSTPDQEDGAIIKGIYFRAAGASVDSVGGILCLAKNTQVKENGLINFTTGIKGQNTEVFIIRNQINSCVICIDDSGGESHIVDNHGYPESIGILLRGSATTVRGNKFYGDGASAPTGIEVRGSGNLIIGGVLDAFIDAAVRFKPISGTDCNNNIVSGVNVSGTGVAGQTYQTPFVFDAGAANVSGNMVTGCPVFNKRADRATKYLASFVGVGAFDCSDNRLSENAIDRNSLTVGVVQSTGAKAVRNTVGRNAGLVTSKTFTKSVINGEIVTVTGLDLPIASIYMTPAVSTVGSFAWDSKTGTSFRVLLRDLAGATISTPVAINFTVDCVI